MKLTNFIAKVLPLSLVICTSATLASTSLSGFKLAIVKDTVGSSSLKAGQFERGLDELSAWENNIDSFERAMNLCVGKIKTGQLDAAEKSCSTAIEEIKSNTSKNKRVKLLKALAYSNRGIARHLNNNTLPAYDDLLKAQRLSKDKIISDNLALFKASIDHSSRENVTTELAE